MPKRSKTPRVLVVHGPNLNLLGKREPDLYGASTLQSIDRRLESLGRELGLEVECFQSNHEGAMVEKIQASIDSCSGVVINPAAYTHTSVAIRDALLLLDAPIIEVHLSNIDKREPFRRTSLIADVVSARISGLGPMGYAMALKALAKMIRQRQRSTGRKVGP